MLLKCCFTSDAERFIGDTNRIY